MENKQTLIAIILMLVVWMGFSVLFPPQEPAPVANQAPVAESAAPSPAGPAVTPVAPVVPATSTAAVAARKSGSTFAVETSKLILTIDEDLGDIQRIELKDYQETLGGDQGFVTLVDTLGRASGNLQVAGTDGFSGVADLVMRRESSGDVAVAPGDSRAIVFRGEIASGVTLVKTLTISGDSYQIPVSVEVINQGGSALSGNLILSLLQPWNEAMKGSSYDFIGPSTLAGDKKHNDDVDDLVKDPKIYSENLIWTAFEKKYFMSALVPLSGSGEKVRVEKIDDLVLNSVFSPHRQLQPGERVQFDYLAYFGPKDFDILKAADHQLSEAIDFGFFGVLARPLLHVLKFFNTFLHNYGLAIILLTVIIKLLFWPLTQKSYKSMKGMQKLQPQMQKLREKYKNDKQRLNMELMNLYKEHRVNPLGGCLPMVIQIPVFFALYKVLLASIELRHAPFFLWIVDLSAKDPYYITPVVMGATMFIQQKMTPSTMDPMQAKIFLAMPIVFTALFLNFPAGLVIYWLVNNLLTIGQQYLINRK